MSLRFRGCGMDMQFAKAAPERLLLIPVDFWIAKEHDKVVGECVMDLLICLITQWLSQIKTAYLGTYHRIKRLDLNCFIVALSH